MVAASLVFESSITLIVYEMRAMYNDFLFCFTAILGLPRPMLIPLLMCIHLSISLLTWLPYSL